MARSGSGRHRADDLGGHRCGTVGRRRLLPKGEAHGQLMGEFLPFSGNNIAGYLAAKSR